MGHLKESKPRILVVDDDLILTEHLRTAMADRLDVMLAASPTAICTSSSLWTQMDQDAQRAGECERAAWNAAVDAKKAARQQRRAAHRWSRA